MMMSIPLLLALQIGVTVPDFRLTDTSGTAHALSSYSGKTVFLAFWSFKCPVSLGYDERLMALQSRYGTRGVVILGIASNSNETAAEIRRNSANLNVGFPILLDQDGALAQRLGATHTPSAFIIDAKGNLQYRGGVAQAEEALEAILDGRAVPAPETKPSGCTIKRR
jgi:peroxiredoxin